MRASITEAKNGLSALIARARRGESVVIEDRGVPVARLESVAAGGPKQVEGRIARLSRTGVVRPPSAPLPKRLLTTAPPTPRRHGLTISEALLAEREEDR